MRYSIFTFFILISLAFFADYYLGLSMQGFQTGLPQEQALKVSTVSPKSEVPKITTSTVATSTYLDVSGQKKFLGPAYKPFIIGPKSPPPGAE